MDYTTIKEWQKVEILACYRYTPVAIKKGDSFIVKMKAIPTAKDIRDEIEKVNGGFSSVSLFLEPEEYQTLRESFPCDLVTSRTVSVVEYDDGKRFTRASEKATSSEIWGSPDLQFIDRSKEAPKGIDLKALRERKLPSLDRLIEAAKEAAKKAAAKAAEEAASDA